MIFLALTIVFLSVQLMPLVECPLILRKDKRWYGGLNARAYCTASGLIPSRSLPIFTHLNCSKNRIKCKRLNKAWKYLFIILKDVYNSRNIGLPMIVVWGKAFYYNLPLTICIRNTGNWSRALWTSYPVKLRFGNMRFAQARCILVTLFFYGLRFANWIKT